MYPNDDCINDEILTSKVLTFYHLNDLEGFKNELQNLTPFFFYIIRDKISNITRSISYFSIMCFDGKLDFIKAILEEPTFKKLSSYEHELGIFIGDSFTYACTSGNLQLINYLFEKDKEAREKNPRWYQQNLGLGKGLIYNIDPSKIVIEYFVLKEASIELFLKFKNGEDIIHILSDWVTIKHPMSSVLVKYDILMNTYKQYTPAVFDRMLKNIKNNENSLEDWLVEILLNSSTAKEFNNIVIEIIEKLQINKTIILNHIENIPHLQKIFLFLKLEKTLNINSEMEIKNKI